MSHRPSNRPRRRPRPRRWLRPAGLLAAALFPLVAVPVHGGPVAAQEPDPGLDQTISAEQPIAPDDAVLSTGHVDIGPRFVDGTWTLMVHDDTAATPTWRSLDRTVLHLDDHAVVTVPDDPTYRFLGAPPGSPVHVVSQTQNPDVVWVGWNTQDPQVMERIDRGATMTLLGVDGPGQVSMYLQSGNFGAPQVLWDSTRPERQSVWVDVNTHTHANWVFTEPGVYLVHVEIAADLVGGERVVDVRDLRFAVGADVDPGAALAASYGGPVAAADPPGSAPREDRSEDTGFVGAPVVVAIVAAVLLLASAAALVGLRGRRIRRRVDRERGDHTTGPAGPSRQATQP